MKPTRGSMLAGLVFVAIAAPVAAYAVSGDDPDPAPPDSTHGPQHAKPSKAPDTTGTEHAAEASAPGRAHAEAMKKWARCVAEAASGPKTEGAPVPPKEACGDKPVSPGRAKHSATPPESPGRSGDHRPEHSRGHGHGHQD
jgi:hypothetical protein